MMARLIRFYHLDPRIIFDIPLNTLRWMSRQMFMLEREERARETLSRVYAAMTPYMDKYDRSKLINRLEREAGMRAARSSDLIKVVEHNPDKAREWFEQRGIELENSNGELQSG